jgi:alcohol dehydrogenase (cytochrome c)
VLTTVGNPVFAGEPSAKLNALNAETGEPSWQFRRETAHHSSPTTYGVDDGQYVAVAK